MWDAAGIKPTYEVRILQYFTPQAADLHAELKAFGSLSGTAHSDKA
jgi:hypothetical protein